MYEDEICRIAEHYIQVRHVLREQTWQDLRDLGRESDRHRTGSNLSIAAHLLQLQFTSYRERAPELHARCISDSRAAALLLAARLHAARHGTLPQAASELVPGELTQLPVDPFTRPRAPLRFRLDPQGVTVWSLGANGTDEAAAVLFDEFGRKRRRWGDGKPADSPDIVYGAAWRTTTSPTAARSQPVGR